MKWVTGLANQLSNPCISFDFVKRWDCTYGILHTFSANFSSTKQNLIAQISTKVVALILFPSVHKIVKGLLQNKSSGMNDEKSNKLLSLTLKGVTFFLDSH